MRCRVQLQGKGMTTFTRVVQLALAAYAGSELVLRSYPAQVRPTKPVGGARCSLNPTPGWTTLWVVASGFFNRYPDLSRLSAFSVPLFPGCHRDTLPRLSAS